jgi:hypothetical protein
MRVGGETPPVTFEAKLEVAENAKGTASFGQKAIAALKHPDLKMYDIAKYEGRIVDLRSDLEAQSKWRPGKLANNVRDRILGKEVSFGKQEKIAAGMAGEVLAKLPQRREKFNEALEKCSGRGVKYDAGFGRNYISSEMTINTRSSNASAKTVEGRGAESPKTVASVGSFPEQARPEVQYAKAIEAIGHEVKGGVSVQIGQVKIDGNIKDPEAAIKAAIGLTFPEASLEDKLDVASSLHSGVASSLKEKLLEQGGTLTNIELEKVSVDAEGNLSASLKGSVLSNYSQALVGKVFSKEPDLLNGFSEKELAIAKGQSALSLEEARSVTKVGDYGFEIKGNAFEEKQEVASTCLKGNPHFNDWDELARLDSLQAAVDDTAFPGEVLKVGMSGESMNTTIKDGNYDVLSRAMKSRKLDLNLQAPENPTRIEARPFVESIALSLKEATKVQKADPEVFAPEHRALIESGAKKAEALEAKISKALMDLPEDLKNEITALKQELSPLENMNKTPLYRKCLAQDIEQSLKDFPRGVSYDIGGRVLDEKAFQSELKSLSADDRGVLLRELREFSSTDTGQDLIKGQRDPTRALIGSEELKEAHAFSKTERYREARELIAEGKGKEVPQEEKGHIRLLESLTESAWAKGYAKSMGVELTGTPQENNSRVLALLMDPERQDDMAAFFKDLEEADMNFLESGRFNEAQEFVNSEKYQKYMDQGVDAVSLSQTEKAHVSSLNSLRDSMFRMRLSHAVDDTLGCSSSEGIERKVAAISLLHQGTAADTVIKVKGKGASVSQTGAAVDHISLDQGGNVKIKYQANIVSDYAFAIATGGFELPEKRAVTDLFNEEEKTRSDHPVDRNEANAMASMGMFTVEGHINIDANSFDVNLHLDKANPNYQNWSYESAPLSANEELQKAVDKVPSPGGKLNVDFGQDSLAEGIPEKGVDFLSVALRDKGLIFEETTRENLSSGTEIEVNGRLQKLSLFIGNVQRISERDALAFPGIIPETLAEQKQQVQDLINELGTASEVTGEMRSRIDDLADSVAPLTHLDSHIFHQELTALGVRQALVDAERGYEYDVDGKMCSISSVQEGLRGLDADGREALFQELTAFSQTNVGKTSSKLEEGVPGDVDAKFLRSEEFVKAQEFMQTDIYAEFKEYEKQIDDTKKALAHFKDRFDKKSVGSEKAEMYMNAMKSLEGSVFRMQFNQAIDETYDCSATKNVETKAKMLSTLHQGIYGSSITELKKLGGNLGGTHAGGVLGTGQFKLEKDGSVQVWQESAVKSDFIEGIATGKFTPDPYDPLKPEEQGVSDLLTDAEKNFSANIQGPEDSQEVASLGTYRINTHINPLTNSERLDFQEVKRNPNFKNWNYQPGEAG